MEESSKLRSHSNINESAEDRVGWLELQTHSLIKSFKKRYLVLENKQLSIYSNCLKTILKFTINFNQIPTEVKNESQRLVISFKLNPTVFVFRGSAEDILEWEKTLLSHIRRACFNKSFSEFTKSKAFFYYYYITDAEFAFKARTGDIILFKGKSKISGAIRGILSCDFDHIAVVYVLNDFPYLLESARSTGVVLTSWDEFINRKWCSMYSRIAYRQLMIERNECFFQLAYQFVIESEGKPYKLVKMKSGDNDGYFCSELVAEFYRRTGVIYLNRPAYKFLPKHFVNDKGINVIQGDLGVLQDIKFN